MVLPRKWPIVLRTEIKHNTQYLCCAVTADSEDRDQALSFLVVLSGFQNSSSLCGFLFFFSFSLAALKVLFPFSQLVSVKYNSETTILVMNSSALALWTLSLQALQATGTRPHAVLFLE